MKWSGDHACLESIALRESGVRFEYDALCQVMFRVGKKYRHKNCIDVDFHVDGLLGENEEIISLIVSYWNRAGYFQGRMKVVSVKKKDLESWKLLDA